MPPVILECVEGKVWNWPAYDDFVTEYGHEFSKNTVQDMAAHIYHKFRRNQFGLFRKSQMDEVKHLRPFWQMHGRCISLSHVTETWPMTWQTRFASDEFWDGDCVPWNCKQLYCQCNVQTLSRFEMTRYVADDCKNDEVAPELLKIWNEVLQIE